MVVVLRVVRHRLGPRVYVFRRRIHEWHVGFAVLAAVAAATIAGRVAPTPALLLALAGVWLIAKDWNDLTGTGRDAAAWRLGLHRRPLRFRPVRPFLPSRRR